LSRAVLLGLIDSHLHATRGGRFYNLELRWDGVPTLKQALGMVREQAKRTPKGEWVRVIGGWSSFQFKERPLRERGRRGDSYWTAASRSARAPTARASRATTRGFRSPGW
jgi:predicted amidohydrolase YtcJ